MRTRDENTFDFFCSHLCLDLFEAENHTMLLFIHRLGITGNELEHFCDFISYHENEKRFSERQLIIYYAVLYFMGKVHMTPSARKDIGKGILSKKWVLGLGHYYREETTLLRDKLKKECAHLTAFMKTVKLIEELEVVFHH
jgi:hypothetical protein